MDLRGPIGERLADWHDQRRAELEGLQDKSNEEFREAAWQAHHLASRLLVDAQTRRKYSARVNIFDIDARLPLDPPADRPDTKLELVLRGAFLVTRLDHELGTNDIGTVEVTLVMTTPEASTTMPLGRTVDPDKVKADEQFDLPILRGEAVTDILKEAARLAPAVPVAG